MKSFLFFKNIEDLTLGKIESEYRGTTEHIAEALNNTDEDIERFILYMMERDEPIRQKVLEFGIDKLLGVYLSIAEGGVSVSIKSKKFLLAGLRTAVTRLLYEAKKKFDIQVSIEFASRYKYWDESTGFPYLLSTFVEDDDQNKEGTLINISTKNIERLKEYFTPGFKGMGKSEDVFSKNLVPSLERVRKSGKEHAAIALLIHESRYFKPSNGLSFRKWYNVYVEILGLDTSSYKPAQLKSTADDLKYREFYFLE